MATDEEIDDKIDAWHNGEGRNQQLHQYLGWTLEEYKAWVTTGKQPDRE